jgi:protein CpxP
MKKETLLTTAVFALLLLNFGTLFFLFSHKGPGGPGKGPRPLDRDIVEKLHLNTEQQAKFEQLKKAHHDQMEQSNRDYRAALSNYFALLKNDSVAQGQRDSLQTILTQIQKNRVDVTFQHFNDLKTLAGPENKGNFEVLLPDLMQVILPRRDRSGPPPRN